MRKHLFALALSIIPMGASAQPVPGSSAASTGSTAFCLYELPPDGDRRTWLNLGIVQYVDLRPTELRVYYGGGNFGGGHEARIPVSSRDEGINLMRKMQDTAANCQVKAPRPNP